MASKMFVGSLNTCWFVSENVKITGKNPAT